MVPRTTLLIPEDCRNIHRRTTQTVDNCELLGTSDA